MDIKILKNQEAYTLSLLERLRLDINEFTKYPCETVCVEQIKYQYSFELRNLKQLQTNILYYELSLQPLKKLSPEFINFLQTPKKINK